jgi:hypothetical protein
MTADSYNCIHCMGLKYKYAIKTVQLFIKIHISRFLPNFLKMYAKIYRTEVSHFVFHDLRKNRGSRLSAIKLYNLAKIGIFSDDVVTTDCRYTLHYMLYDT